MGEIYQEVKWNANIQPVSKKSGRETSVKKSTAPEHLQKATIL